MFQECIFFYFVIKNIVDSLRNRALGTDQIFIVQGRDSGVGIGIGTSKDQDRAKLVRERQQEERQRKLEEIRQQALAAQKFREQREEERRRRIEELRSKESDR